MSAKDLIAALSQLDPETEVFYEVNGEETRTGNYFPVDSISRGDFVALSFGGYEVVSDNKLYTVGEPVSGVVLC